MISHRIRHAQPVVGRANLWRRVELQERIIENLMEALDMVAEAVWSLEDELDAKAEVQALARYKLSEAAAHLRVSPSTLKRRARVGRFVITYDGKTPYVMGAEILRYAREGARRRSPADRQRPR